MGEEERMTTSTTCTVESTGFPLIEKTGSQTNTDSVDLSESGGRYICHRVRGLLSRRSSSGRSGRVHLSVKKSSLSPFSVVDPTTSRLTVSQ